jgi:hypothetical protein
MAMVCLVLDIIIKSANTSLLRVVAGLDWDGGLIGPAASLFTICLQDSRRLLIAKTSGTPKVVVEDQIFEHLERLFGICRFCTASFMRPSVGHQTISSNKIGKEN